MTGMIDEFFGFEIFNSGIFLVGKFGKYFLGWLDLNRGFFWLLITNESALAWPWRIYGMTWFSLCYNFAPPGNLGVIWQGIVLGVVFGSGLYLGYIGRLRDFFESWVLHPFDHPHHLQAGLPPWVWSIHTDLEFQTMCSFVSWEHNALITDGPGCRSGCPINKSPTILQWGSYKQTARTHCTFHLHS